MRVAIVHDYLTQYGGAERVLDELHAIWPDAPVMVALHSPDNLPNHYREWDIRASWLNRIPILNRKHQVLLPFYPQAFESFDMNDYDLVVSSSSGFAHGILTGPNTAHVCYCHSPPRFLWDYHRYVQHEQIGLAMQVLVNTQLTRLRTWDLAAADRTDVWISTSRHVQARLSKFYRKNSTVIAPPIDVNRFRVGRGRGKYFLMLMRLVGWKRPDVIVDACSRLGVEVVVAGDGRELARLRERAGPSVKFFGRANDEQMRALYRDCRALILPSEEDFGITPLEAMASGRPVIAYGRGGVLDTVVPGVTGTFFEEQTPESVMDAIMSFDDSFDPGLLRRHAMQYDRVAWRTRIREEAEAAMAAQSSVAQYAGASSHPVMYHENAAGLPLEGLV